MRRITLPNELIDIDGQGYIKADVLVSLENHTEGHARIEGMGRVAVYRKECRCCWQSIQSFAWYVKVKEK